MVSRSDYTDKEVNACKSVLIEIVHLLSEIKDEMVIIGGWIPSFLFPESNDTHIGSLDIDVALNFAKISNKTYQTILDSILKRGYTQDTEQPFRFFREVKVEGSDPVNVEVDFMAGEYGGTGRRHRTQRVQDIQARKARGCDLAFNSTTSVTLYGELPDGGKDKVFFKIAGIVPFLVMKGMALFQRMKEKDAYDIFYCIEHYPGGLQELTDKFIPSIKNKLVIEGLGKIRSKFASIEHIGPKWVADFLEIENKDDREIIMRRAYEKVTEFLDRLNIPEWENG